MFFFSKGFLHTCGSRTSISAASAGTSTNEGCVFKLPDPKPILLVKDIIKQFSTNGREYIVFCLYDGQNHAFAAVLKSLIDDSLSYNSSDVCFQAGSVLMLHEYYITKSKNEALLQVAGQFENLIESLDPSKVVMVILEKFTLIGCQPPDRIIEQDVSTKPELSTLPEASSAQSCQTKCEAVEADDDGYECIKISDLHSDLSRSKWSIRACLSNVSSVRSFESRTNGSKGKTMRVQLFDDTGYIELAFFNDFCNQYSSFFKTNTIYTIRNADVKLSKKTLKAWQDPFNSIYDLYVNANTTITADANQDAIEKTFLNDKLEEKTPKVQQQQPNDPKSDFIELNQLAFKKVGSLVKTTAFVCKIHGVTEINRVGKSKLPIRRVEIIDNTAKKPIKVALWGTQAQECPFILGRVYLITDAELTNYGGLSLSIIKKSGIMDVTGYYNVPGVEKLSMWWRKEKSKWMTQDQQIDESFKRKQSEENKENAPGRKDEDAKRQKKK